jgi:hypothetical protein
MINLKEVSCCLITKDSMYPPEVLMDLMRHPFGEILILTNCDSPHRKYELFAKSKFDLIYYQDDDAVCPVAEIAQKSVPDRINVAMKKGHYDQYSKTRMTMGLGWGSIFPKKLLESLDRYTKVYGEDEVYKRETERILTYLNWPQNRMVLNIVDLPSAYASDRLSMQPNHYNYIPIVEDRCSKLL